MSAKGPVTRVLTDVRLLYATFLATCFGAYYSSAALSIATVVFGISGLIVLLDRNGLRKALASKTSISFVLVFAAFLLSGLNSHDTDQWLTRANSAIAFLIVPIGMYAFGPLSKEVCRNLLLVFVGVTTMSAMLVGADYALHIQEYNELYKVGKTIPTPIAHPQYSFMVAVAALALGSMIRKDWIGPLKWRRIAIGVLITLVLFIHLLAVRTGLVTFYAGALTLIALQVFREKKWKFGIWSLTSLVVVLLLGYLTMPSVQNKLAYVKWDLQRIDDTGFSPEYSDNLRIISILQGLELFHDNAVLGVGIGDIDAEMAVLYNQRDEDLTQEQRFHPISQYVFWLSTLGIIGTSIVLLGLLYPLFVLWRESILVVVLYAATLTSILAENTILMQAGAMVFTILICTLIQFYRGQMEVQPLVAPEVS